MPRPAYKNGNDNFLFDAIPPDSGLKRDEPNIVVRLLCLSIFALAIIDIVVIIFFFRTNARIEAIRHDKFTEDVISNLEESEQKHENFAEKAKEIIRNKNAYIKEFVDHMEFDSKELDKINVDKIEIPSLPKLQAALEDLESEDEVNLQKLKAATVLYNEVEQQMKALNNYLMPVDEFNHYQDKIEKNLEVILKEIKSNLDNFLEQLLYLAQNQNANQKALMEEMKDTLAKFEEIYGFVYKNGRYTKLNNYYEVDFISFDRDYVPFAIEFDNRHFGAQLTKEVGFILRMPRMYYCTLQAVLYSDNTFNVRFQYVDKNAGEDGKDVVLFDSEPIQGGFGKPFSFSGIKVFSLDASQHTLYLRIISEGNASQLHMQKMKMVCLSYRNFMQNAKGNELEDDL